MTDLAGAILELYAYDAYGNAIGFDPSVALTEFLYSGEQFDSKIGQQYLRARYYDPATGRFNRLDPFFGNLDDPQSLHNYLYAHSNPVGYYDPLGQFIVSVCIGLAVQSHLRGGDTSIKLGAKGWALASITVFSAIAESLLWLHLGFSFVNSGWRQAQTGMGGKDVTKHLDAIQDKFTKQWNSYTTLEKEKIYESLTTMWAMKFINAWDIYEFAHDKNTFAATGNSDTCDGTVTINGKVYLSEEVNYFLWGLVSSLANNDGLSNSRTLDEAVTKATLYRRVIYPNKTGTDHVAGRVAWIKAGWDAGKIGQINYPTEVALPNATPNSEIYPNGITVKLGIKDGLSIMDNISGGMDSYYIYFITNASQ